MRALISYPEQQPSALEKAMVALARAETAPQPSQRHAAALAVYPRDQVVAGIIRAASAPATTTSTGFGAELGQSLVGEFLSSLSPLSAAARIAAMGLTVDLGRATEMKLPARGGSPAATVDWVQEDRPIPVRQYALNDDCLLAPRKFGFIVTISRELAKRASGEVVIRQLIREDAAASFDGSYFNDGAGDDAEHAGMLAGIAPFAGYAGGDDVAMRRDLEALTSAVCAAGSGQVVLDGGVMVLAAAERRLGLPVSRRPRWASTSASWSPISPKAPPSTSTT
jgi:hypothetical protein